MQSKGEWRDLRILSFPLPALCSKLVQQQRRVPHLRRSFIAPKVGHRAQHDPFSRDMESVGIFAAAKIAHLSDDKAVAKTGHPMVVVGSDVGHPPLSEVDGIVTLLVDALRRTAPEMLL